MFEYINGWEWLLIVLFTFAGFLMIQFVEDIEIDVDRSFCIGDDYVHYLQYPQS